MYGFSHAQTTSWQPHPLWVPDRRRAAARRVRRDPGAQPPPAAAAAGRDRPQPRRVVPLDRHRRRGDLLGVPVPDLLPAAGPRLHADQHRRGVPADGRHVMIAATDRHQQAPPPARAAPAGRDRHAPRRRRDAGPHPADRGLELRRRHPARADHARPRARAGDLHLDQQRHPRRPAGRRGRRLRDRVSHPADRRVARHRPALHRRRQRDHQLHRRRPHAPHPPAARPRRRPRRHHRLRLGRRDLRRRRRDRGRRVRARHDWHSPSTRAPRRRPPTDPRGSSAVAAAGGCSNRRCHSGGGCLVSWGAGSSRTQELMMRVFVAGATGAIGRQLVPRLVEAGHEVHGMTRSESKQAMLYELGAVPVVADALDPDQVAEAVARARPDVIVHQLTAIGAVDTRHMERDFALTNRLRTEGTDHLLSAGQAVGVRRFVAQSHIASYARTGAGQARRGPVRPLTRARDARVAGGDASARDSGARRRLDRGDRAALRLVLRAGHVHVARCGAARVGPQAQVPAGRRRRRGVVLHPRGRRGGGDGVPKAETQPEQKNDFKS